MAILALLVVLGLASSHLASSQKTVTLRTGGNPAPTDGGPAELYNSTHDTSITSQYSDSWNYYNGMTYFWGSTKDSDYTFTLSDAKPTERFRTLLRFGNLQRYVPAGSVVQSAQLTVTFINWNGPVLVEGCFMTRAWSPLLNGPRYKSTGWAYSIYDVPSAKSLNWTEPGGWADCSPSSVVRLVVPGNGNYGYVSQTLALDPAVVATWATGNANNFGMLFRAINGSVSFVTSQWVKDSPALRRPALAVTYTAPGTPPPPPLTYPAQLGAVPRVWWVSPWGNDEANSGHADSPFASPAKALFEAWPGDLIYLTTGVYPGALNIQRPRITMQSAPGHWAVISLPMDDPQNAVNVITIRPGADYGVLRNLEIKGGFYYGIMFFTSWENYGAMADRVALGAGPRHWLVQNVRIHHTGSSGVKMVMKATNTTFSSCEIYETGARLRTAGHGIEAVQAYDVAVRDCYFHDIPAAAVHLAGGTARAVLERNFVARTRFGFNMGFATDYEYMDPINNPALYESINCTARNNIIASVSQAGINLWAARGAVVAHNTIWHAQQDAQSCILINAYTHAYTPSGAVLSRCYGVTVWANLLVRSATARAGPVVQIRTDGLDPNSPLVMAHNVYYDTAGLGLPVFAWGKGAMLEDERAGSAFVGNATGWARHCTVTLGQAQCDINSIEADPRLNAAFTPLACSPAKGRAPTAPPASSALVTDDFHGRPRAPSTTYDAGAVQSTAAGAVKPMPPVPAAFAAAPVFNGVGLGPVYDKNWPYNFWLTRVCRDLVVDAVAGTDSQAFNYESNYRPFKTIQAALININQCDRILLRGGQNHTGGFGIYRPNVTITTHPADAPKRATVVCTTTGATPCIRTGEGLYGGAAALQLYGFDIVMGGTAAGSCIHLNEGSGGATSAYWSYYLKATGKGVPGPSVIRDMSLTSCGLHGIKLSTFVRGVAMEGLTITSPRQAGVEVRGGSDVAVRRCRILSPGETAVRLGGGARNVVVERNLIRNYGGRGILLGSDNTEVAYMDVDWALQQQQQPQAPAWAGWHDCVNALVRNNVVEGGAGAAVAFYSVRDAVVVHNTLLGAAATMQAAVLLNVSPKQLGPSQEVAAPNVNITFKNNIVTLAPTASSLLVEARIMQASMPNKQLNLTLPAATCPARHLLSHHHRRQLRASHAHTTASSTSIISTHTANTQQQLIDSPKRRQLAGLSFAEAFVNAPGEQGRNPDGLCPLFPADHAWRMDVSGLPLHPNSDAIKGNIGRGTLHADFGGGIMVDGQRVLYGIPFITVDSSKGTPMVPITIGPSGYPSESDLTPNAFPFPPNAPVEGAYLNCPNARCPGDRHVLVVDNATCLLYETWRSMPPAVTGGTWQADIVARFNLSRNALGRPLGWTSADAAGLAVLPGLVKWDEVITKGFIDHAIRFTGPNSRRAYAPPATHFAPTGYQGPDAPYMGMRVRLSATYDCTKLARAARIFCVALQKYGGIFADNGGAWYFSGEATTKWDAYLSELYDISKIPSSAMEVLDSGCLCLDASCTVAECAGGAIVDPNALPVYSAIASTADLKFANNIYSYKQGTAAGRYVDRRVAAGGAVGYDGGLAGWKSYIGGDAGSMEADPALDEVSYRPKAGSPAKGSVPRLEAAGEDYYGTARGPVGGVTDAGAALA